MKTLQYDTQDRTGRTIYEYCYEIFNRFTFVSDDCYWIYRFRVKLDTQRSKWFQKHQVRLEKRSIWREVVYKKA